MTARVGWAGRLDHHELRDLLPASRAIVVPSTFPEAFGMVAAEGAASGALPVVARHSAWRRSRRQLAPAVGPEVGAWMSFELGPRAVHDLADHLSSWLTAPGDVRRAAREAIVSTHPRALFVGRRGPDGRRGGPRAARRPAAALKNRVRAPTGARERLPATGSSITIRPMSVHEAGEILPLGVVAALALGASGLRAHR
jgi:hypothetical protein